MLDENVSTDRWLHLRLKEDQLRIKRLRFSFIFGVQGIYYGG